MNLEREIVDHGAIPELSDKIGDFDDGLCLGIHAPKKKTRGEQRRS